MYLNSQQKVYFLNIAIFMNFVFISTFILIIVLTLKQCRFCHVMFDKVEIWSLYSDIKTKFMKIVKFKKQKLFIPDLNAKVIKIQDFNINFSIFISVVLL